MDNPNIQTIVHGNAQAIFAQYKEILTKQNKLTIDFNQTSKFDSSIFAVILGLRRIANQHNYSLSIELSPSLKTLADVYGIYDIL